MDGSVWYEDHGAGDKGLVGAQDDTEENEAESQDFVDAHGNQNGLDDPMQKEFLEDVGQA